MFNMIKVVSKFFLLFSLGFSIGYIITLIIGFDSNFIDTHNPMVSVAIIVAVAFGASELDIQILEKYFQLKTDFYFFKKQISPFVLGMLNGFLILIIDKL